MTIEQFWKIIDKSRRGTEGDIDFQAEQLKDILLSLGVDEIISFENIFDDFFVRSYTSDLWAAAYIINGGCSDDGFDYFRAWLIGRGKKVFEAALENPELLIKFIPVELAGEIEGEQLMYSGSTAYEELTGKENLEELLSTNSTLPVIELDWTDENVNDKFPKLAKKFC